MPPPTVTSVSPSSGLSRGGSLVFVNGTNFATVGAVTVSFGTRLATSVEVRSATKLSCLPPRGEIALGATSLAVTVTVTNVVAAESDFLASAYTYRRPDLTVESHLLTVIRTLMTRMSEQLLENTVLTTHTDFDLATSDLQNRVELAKVPVVILAGPTLIPHRIVNYNDRPPVFTGSPNPTAYKKYDQHRAVTLEFDVRILSKAKSELLNLVHQAMAFQMGNEMLEVLRDPLNPGAGSVHYPLMVVGEFVAADRPSRANLREAVGRWSVEGVLIEDGDLVEDYPTVDVTTLTTEAL